jgi:magnesium transporter
VEDCRDRTHRTKVEDAGSYLFVILSMAIPKEEELSFSMASLAIFVGHEFVISIHEIPISALKGLLREHSENLRPDQFLHRVLDGAVESWLPVVEGIEERIDGLQDQVAGWANPDVLERIASTRSLLMQLRRVAGSARRAVYQLLHSSNSIITSEVSPFLRDVHDDLTVHLETIASERDRLTGIMDIYLSSVTNRTAEATRTLTLLGTIGMPAMVITGLLGMGISYPSWVKARWVFEGVLAVTVLVTGFLLWYLKAHDYLPGGTTARLSRESEARAGDHGATSIKFSTCVTPGEDHAASSAASFSSHDRTVP